MLTMLFQGVSSNDNTQTTTSVIMEKRIIPENMTNDGGMIHLNKEPDPTGPGFCR